jgi:ribosomal protein S18 acetylase RimI-like enzyme
LNDDNAAAALRLERGSSEFLRSCADTLFELGAPAVWSAPVDIRGQKLWERAGFTVDRQLLLMERSLARPIAEPSIRPRNGTVEEALPIDSLAFEGDWRIGRLGLEDALSATVRSRLLIAHRAQVEGFAIVGVTGSAGYLQRIAVLPSVAGSGSGRSLVRASMLWARMAGARQMLLNTQPDNERAAGLYRSEGFNELPERLSVLTTTPR